MDIFFTALFASAVALCSLSAALIYYLGQGLNTRYLSGFLAIEAIFFTIALIFYQPDERYSALMTASLMMICLLVAPCLWAFVRESTENKALSSNQILSRKEKVAIWIGFALITPLLALEFIWSWISTDGIAYKASYDRFMFTALAGAIIIFTAQIPWYMSKIWRAVTQHLNSSNNSEDYKSTIRSSLRLLLLIILSKWLVTFGFTVSCFTPLSFSSNGQLFALTEVVIVVWSLFQIVSHGKNIKAQLLLQPRDIKTHTEAAKYEKSGICDNEVSLIANKLQNALHQEEWFYENNFNMKLLSKKLGVQPQYISQVLNQKLGTSFYDLLSAVRIKRATSLLIENPESSIIDIAYQAGFNSKSTFNTAFKRHTGCTPSQFRLNNQPPLATIN